MKSSVRFAALIASASLLSGLGGCAALPGQGMDKRTAELRAELDTARQEQERLTEANRDLESRLSSASASSAAQTSTAGVQLLPPSAKAGECYSRVTVPAKYESRSEQVLKSGASERIEVEPAKYEWVEQRVQVQPASERIVKVIPAQYRSVEERVLARPAGEKVVAVAATYRTVEDRELVRPAQTVWKTGRGSVERVNEETGEIMCLVEIPAEYRTIRKRMVDTPASTKVIQVPAEYTTVTRKELLREAEVIKETVPAVFETVKVQRELSPAKTRKVAIPAEYQTVERRERVRDAGAEWRRVVCKTNATPELITSLQRALQKQGFDVGLIDGILGQDTLRATRQYERANDLAIGSTGAVPYETLASLGVGGR